jgi:hypothetical protein
VIVLGDPPEAWERLGFTVVDGTVTLGAEQLVLTGEGGGILEVRAPGVAAADGLPLRGDDAPARPASAHPNGATVVDHVVVLTGSLQRTVGALQAAGLDLRREMARMAFLRLGSYILEVVERGGDPARFWGLVVVVPDPGAVPGAGPVRDAVQPGRRIATVKGLGTELALLTPRRT